MATSLKKRRRGCCDPRNNAFGSDLDAASKAIFLRYSGSVVICEVELADKMQGHARSAIGDTRLAQEQKGPIRIEKTKIVFQSNRHHPGLVMGFFHCFKKFKRLFSKKDVEISSIRSCQEKRRDENQHLQSFLGFLLMKDQAGSHPMRLPLCAIVDLMDFRTIGGF